MAAAWTIAKSTPCCTLHIPPAENPVSTTDIQSIRKESAWTDGVVSGVQRGDLKRPFPFLKLQVHEETKSGEKEE